MNPASWASLGLAAVAAAGDWLAVHRAQKRLEYLCKPLTIAFLIGVAATVDVDHSAVRVWFIAALALSMLGDVFLMLPKDVFVPGLVSFLLAHLAFIAGLWANGVEGAAFALGGAVAAVAVAVVGPRVIRAVRGGDQREMAVPVAA